MQDGSSAILYLKILFYDIYFVFFAARMYVHIVNIYI